MKQAMGEEGAPGARRVSTKSKETSRYHSSNKQVDSEPILFVDVGVRVLPSDR